LDPSTVTRPGRNDACHCGSGRKYKQCCLSKDEAADRAARAKAAESAPAPAPEEASAAAQAAQPAAPRQGTKQPWKKGSTNTRGFQRMSAPRKVGSG
jgi:hypothetical protein